MNTRIVIVGAGGFGRELLAWLHGSPRYLSAATVSEIVFVDDRQDASDLPGPIISDVAGYVPHASDQVLCAIGEPGTRDQVVHSLSARAARFATFVDDRVILGERVTIGQGAVLCPGVVVTSDVCIGAHALININASLGHDVRVEDFVTVSPGCNLMGGVVVRKHAYIGAGSTVIPGKTVGARSMVGAGSVVVRSVPPDVTAFGNPSSVIKEVAK